jgi:hypothetical protein
MSFFSLVAIIDDVNEVFRGMAAEMRAKFGSGFERCLAVWLSLLNIRVLSS